MQKVYILLRNNQQSGPFSLEELIQFDLKPYDLIWIEGKSQGWYYPQEIQSLHPYLPFVRSTPPLAASGATAQDKTTTAQATPKKIFVSLPSDTPKDGPAPKPSFGVTPGYREESSSSPSGQHQSEELQTTYVKSLAEVEADYMNWVYQKKTRKKIGIPKEKLLAACFVAGIALGGWWIGKSSSGMEEKPVAVQRELSRASNDTALHNTEQEVTEEVTDKASAPASSENKQNVREAKQPRNVSNENQSDTKAGEHAVTSLPPDSKIEEPVPAENREHADGLEEQETDPVAVAEPKEQKKKLRDKIADLFRKKGEEETPSAAEGNAERRSERRASDADLAQMVRIRLTIPNDWMLGIKGARATLVNHNQETIARATVALLYYDDNGELLEQKTVTFGKVESKKSVTVPVPDHALAAKLEYNILSVAGASESYERQ